MLKSNRRIARSAVNRLALVLLRDKKRVNDPFFLHKIM